MRTIHFSLEREEGSYYVFSDLRGFYLWTTDTERLLASVVPLAQHVIWRNEHLAMLPKGNSDLSQLLSKNELSIEFETSPVPMRSPSLPLSGDWWQSPDHVHFFVSHENGFLSEKLLEKIKDDLRARRV